MTLPTPMFNSTFLVLKVSLGPALSLNSLHSWLCLPVFSSLREDLHLLEGPVCVSPHLCLLVLSMCLRWVGALLWGPNLSIPHSISLGVFCAQTWPVTPGRITLHLPIPVTSEPFQVINVSGGPALCYNSLHLQLLLPWHFLHLEMICLILEWQPWICPHVSLQCLLVLYWCLVFLGVLL